MKHKIIDKYETKDIERTWNEWYQMNLKEKISNKHELNISNDGEIKDMKWMPNNANI